MEKYESPMLEILVLDSEDIIICSCITDEETETDPAEGQSG